MSGCCKSNSELVQIGKDTSCGCGSAADESAAGIGSIGIGESSLVSITRRGFLKGLGATSALTVAACAPDVTEKIFPNVKGEGEQIPGVAVWYNTTCTECAAGCGIQVRTREGRAVKIEGNPLHPVNRGSLCGLGQASLQHLYDPDRIRQPLKRVSPPSEKARFEPITWEEAYAAVKGALAENKNDKYFITGELGGGSLGTLVANFSKENGFKQVTFDALAPTPFAKASEKVFGTYGIPDLDFSKADLVVNFGADFLETWISPCQYSKDWSIARQREQSIRVVHFEPRASLTAANADEWHAIAPGTELNLAKALLRAVTAAAPANALSGSVQSALASFDDAAALKAANIEAKVITGAAKALVASKGSLVISGGTLGLTADAQELAEVCLLTNAILGNLGKTIDYSRVRTPESSVEALSGAIKAMSEKKVGVLFVYDTNPAFSLPSSYGYEYSARHAAMTVTFSSHLDETTQMADIVLPSNTSLESWGDSIPYAGVHNVLQPVMTPVFDTKPFGDHLLQISADNGKKIADADVKSQYDFVRSEWKKVYAKNPGAGDFEDFWKKTVEKGGVFEVVADKAAPTVAAAKIAEVLQAKQATSYDKKGSESDSLVVYPFVSVKSFDGRAANRPWLQELPDPVTKVVWDSWAELHPETAKSLDLENGDIATINNFYGEVNLPVYVSPYVHKGIVALPLGNGHTGYGRYAESVTGGNSFSLLAPTTVGEGTAAGLLVSMAKVSRAHGRSNVVITQGSFDQLGRGLARTEFIDEPESNRETETAETAHIHPTHDTVHHVKGMDADDMKATDVSAEGAHGGGGEEHATEPYPHGAHGEKIFYKQREHPLYQWGMVVDLNACTGCSACVVACYAENNIAVVGQEGARKNRTMSWLRIERYDDGGADELQVNFLPMMCQHCGNAPCEPVCPVYATYHNEEGLNAMVYNRCVGTRYCGNNCSYKVRRFNFAEYDFPSPLDMQLNPDVTRRVVGVMEKCTFCVQRIVEAKDSAKDEGRLVRDGEVKPACVQGCPTNALTFGNRMDPESKINKLTAANHERAYKVLDADINTQPAVTYLARRKYKKSIATEA